MSYWDFGRPPTGEHDAPEPAGPGDTAYQDDPWPADNAWNRDDPSRADGDWPQDDPWPADNGWTRDDPWPAAGGWPPDGWQADGGQADGGQADGGLADADDDEGTAVYPITYERDAFTPAGARPAGPVPDDGYEPWPPAPDPADNGSLKDTAVPADDPALAGYGKRTDDFAGGRPADAPWRDGAWPGRRRPGVAGHGWPGQVPGEPGDEWEYQGSRGGRRRWLVPAAVAVAAAAVGAAAVLLTSGPAGGPAGGQAGQSAGRPAARAPMARGTASATAGAATTAPAGAPLTVSAAQGVLAGYTTVNNEANARRSDALLATIEGGSSYAIDAGIYQVQRAAGSPTFPPFSPVQATYYIPRGQQGAGPRWFVVQVANAFTSSPAKVTSAEYLLFTQSGPGAPWRDTVEPYLLAGAGAPQVAVGSDGMATAVGPAAATVAVAPGQLPAVTAASLDGTGGGQAGITAPGNLADRADQLAWQAAVRGGQVSDAHAPAGGADGQEFALLTADGGALVFYTDAATVTITPPAGTQLRLTIPGFFSPAQALTQARVTYLEQFAAYDPPLAAGGPVRVVGDFSAITGTG